MNLKQKIVLWIGIAIIVGMGLFPPLMYVGHGFLFGHHCYKIYFSRLALQMGLVVIITGGLILTMKKK